MYAPNVFDVAGFALGIAEYAETLPLIMDIEAGDSIIAFPSNGVHSNGFSLIHKLMSITGYKWSDTAPFSANKRTFGEEFLEPTKIYINDVKPALETKMVKALAHITGGGLWDNIPRVLPHNLTAELEGKRMTISPVFGWISSCGNVDKLELMKTFNCGIGMIMITSKENELEVMKSLHGTQAYVVGRVIPTKVNGHQVIIRHFATCFERVERLLSAPKKRVAVLISGR
jgi:phosphoribosylamine--glycine ligase/phosphoribosylglycinamide formyltransferase/phosphoribosylformylglycinamidine cyclo-ligase